MPKTKRDCIIVKSKINNRLNGNLNFRTQFL